MRDPVGGEPVRDEATRHLGEDELAGFLDRDLEPSRRRLVELHLEACAQCRAELVTTQRVAAAFAGSRRSRMRWVLPLAAAAILVGVMALPRSALAPARGVEPTRALGAGGEGEAPITIVQPPEGALVRGAVVFSWRSAAADVYRLTLLEESGEPVWTLETVDTVVTLPDSVRLRGGASYFWRVDAIQNGLAATSGVHRLQRAP